MLLQRNLELKKKSIFIILQIWKSSTWAEMLARLCSFWRLQGSVHFLVFSISQILPTFFDSWIFPSSAPHAAVQSSCGIALTLAPSPYFTYKDLRVYTVPIWITQYMYPIPKSLITTAKSLLPCHVIYSQVPKLKVQLFRGGIILPTTGPAANPVYILKNRTQIFKNKVRFLKIIITLQIFRIFPIKYFSDIIQSRESNFSTWTSRMVVLPVSQNFYELSERLPSHHVHDFIHCHFLNEASL